MTGRIAALNRAMRATAMTASIRRSTVSRGMIQAVAANEMVATMRVISSRLRSATRPPRHSHSTRNWVS